VCVLDASVSVAVVLSVVPEWAICTLTHREWKWGRTGFDGAYDDEWASQVRYDHNSPKLGLIANNNNHFTARAVA
jgi:hypothetical protein